LVTHYTFDDGAGLVAHESTGLGTDGVLYGFPTDNSQWVPGAIGGALEFRGANFKDAVIAPNYVKPTASMTASAWVWAKSAPQWAMIMANWGDAAVGQFHFGLESTTGKLSVHFDAAFSATTSDDALFPLGSWKHVAFVADAVAKTVTLYHDGQPVGAPGPYDGALVSPPMSALGIGVKTNDAGTQPDTANPGYWDGKLDDMGIWTRALSPAEIALIHQAGLVGVAIDDIGTLPSGHSCSTNVTCASGSCVAGACS
jgi:hypothetical protein